MTPPWVQVAGKNAAIKATSLLKKSISIISPFTTIYHLIASVHKLSKQMKTVASLSLLLLSLVSLFSTSVSAGNFFSQLNQPARPAKGAI